MILKTAFLLCIIWINFGNLEGMKVMGRLKGLFKNPHDLLVEAFSTIARNNELLSSENSLASADVFWYPYLPGHVNKEQKKCRCLSPFQLDCGYGVLNNMNLYSGLSEYCLHHPKDSIPLNDIELDSDLSSTVKFPAISEADPKAKSKEYKTGKLLHVKKILETVLISNYDCNNEKWTVYFSDKSIPQPTKLMTLSELSINDIKFFESPAVEKATVIYCRSCPGSPALNQMVNSAVSLVAGKREGITLDWKPKTFKATEFSLFNIDKPFQQKVSTLKNVKELKEMIKNSLIVPKSEELLRQSRVCHVSFRSEPDKKGSGGKKNKGRFLFCHIDESGKAVNFQTVDFKVNGDFSPSLLQTPWIQHMHLLTNVRTAQNGEKRGLHLDLKANVRDDEPATLKL